MQMMKLPVQTPAVDRDFRNQVSELSAAGVNAVPSGWLDILKNAALGALKGAAGG